MIFFFEEKGHGSLHPHSLGLVHLSAWHVWLIGVVALSKSRTMCWCLFNVAKAAQVCHDDRLPNHTSPCRLKLYRSRNVSFLHFATKKCILISCSRSQTASLWFQASAKFSWIVRLWTFLRTNSLVTKAAIVALNVQMLAVWQFFEVCSLRCLQKKKCLASSGSEKSVCEVLWRLVALAQGVRD